MTIQNIEDVMERILSLNRNLTEDSLRDLLNASGWDKEDISEGIKIFKKKEKDIIVAPITNIINKTADYDRLKELEEKENKKKNLVYTKQNEFENIEYQLKLKENIEKKNNAILKELEPAIEEKPKTEGLSFNQNLNLDNLNKKEESNYTEINVEQNQNLKNYDENIKEALNNQNNKKPAKKIEKILFYLLLLIFLFTLGIYFFFPDKINSLISSNYNDKIELKNNSLIEDEVENIVKEEKDINEDITLDLNEENKDGEENKDNKEKKDDQNTKNINSTNTEIINNYSKTELNDLKKELELLKTELEKYKNKEIQEKTIIKYISQKGATGAQGKQGRGILNVNATTTGFLVNYTDNTSEIIEYSTTTILNILNAKNVCFNDASSTTTNVCLDSQKVLEILSK